MKFLTVEEVTEIHDSLECLIKYNIPEFEEMVCQVAQSQMNKKQISEFLAKNLSEESPL